ncbi:MAG: hypothetical protein JNN15_19935 [Blastocatellia bacterium]|nr:hypothetical protein [Blastocatellia bacterium]
MIIYWEGASTVEGVFQGKPIKGRSYIELVGYDRSHENLTIFDFFMSEIRYRSIGM